MDLLRNIKELLRDHDRAFIPGFGGFVKERTPAWLDRSADRFHPPGCTILFNRRLGKEDGHLAEHLMKEEGLSFEDAQERIRELASEWERVLEERKRLELDGIGILFKDEEGKIGFEPEPDQELEPSAYGLRSFFAEPAERSRGTIPMQEQEEVGQEKGIEEEGPGEEEQQRSLPIGKVAAILIPLFLLSSYALLRIERGPELGHFSELIPLSLRSEPDYRPRERPFNFRVPLDTLPMERKKPPFSFRPMEEGPSYTVHKMEKEEASKEEALRSSYLIIGGCFMERSNAEARKRALAKEGFPSRILDQKRKGLFVVIFEDHRAREKALESLRRARRTMRDAWILHGSAL